MEYYVTSRYKYGPGYRSRGKEKRITKEKLHVGVLIKRWFSEDGSAGGYIRSRLQRHYSKSGQLNKPFTRG